MLLRICNPSHVLCSIEVPLPQLLLATDLPALAASEAELQQYSIPTKEGTEALPLMYCNLAPLGTHPPLLHCLPRSTLGEHALVLYSKLLVPLETHRSLP